MASRLLISVLPCRRTTLWCCFALMGLVAIDARSKEVVSITSLLEEMTDRSQLCQFPQPEYTCKQFSSYDRRATSAEDQESWYANWDRSQFVRIEERDGGKEFVLMDAEGPGAIVRFWGTWHGPKGKPFSNGTLRVYLDGSDTPAIEGPVADVIDGGLLTEGPLSQGVSPKTEYRRRGHNLYLPIPYAKGCKITYQTDVFLDEGGKTGEALYYQINYRTYEPGTQVETFSMERLRAAQAALESTQAELTAGGRPSGADWKQVTWHGNIAPKQSVTLAAKESSGAVRRIRLKVDPNASLQALRSTVIKMQFDGEECVWVPLGDFFGVGYKPQPYQSWYTAYSDDGVMSCEWVMPFAKGCDISLENLSGEAVAVELGEVSFSDWKWDDRSLHFHSTWRQYTEEVTGGSDSMDVPDGASDKNYVTVEGQGVYAGDTLTLFNGAAEWWGEGDEKIYVDGETFPSHFGTGTEDYYGYAWCRPESFAAPFHAQPEGGGNLKGGFSVNSRYRALDAIPFEKSIKFDMELWHWAATKVNYAPTTFFYARPGAVVNVAPDAESAKLKVVLDLEEFASK
ncbi:glycoside hydrolase family 172 protein [Aeoliella sp.]|uniref:glycoside hydrolase family 172 protein n=1 Tax=Aeoliella sp. TaxID=2795800 RepID=UPI003CCC054D